MSTFERITYRPEGATRSRSVYLENPTEITVLGAPALTGVEVGIDGEEKAPAGVDERRHVIALALITDRVPYRLSAFYGLLAPAGQSDPEDRWSP